MADINDSGQRRRGAVRSVMATAAPRSTGGQAVRPDSVLREQGARSASRVHK